MQLQNKVCTCCNQSLPISDFSKRADSPTGYAYHCKPCKQKKAKSFYDKNREKKREQDKLWYKNNSETIRKRQVERIYGITFDEYTELLKDQKGGCAICSVPLKTHWGVESEYEVAKVDHCHTTGKVRGLLCNKCNVSLGNLNDDIELFKNAINYLEKYNETK